MSIPILAAHAAWLVQGLGVQHMLMVDGKWAALRAGGRTMMHGLVRPSSLPRIAPSSRPPIELLPAPTGSRDSFLLSIDDCLLPLLSEL